MTVDEYRYPKCCYTRLAVMLIYGKRSKHVEHFSVFGLPPHDRTRLEYREIEKARDESLGSGINNCTREVHFGDGRYLASDFTMGTGINTILIYAPLRDRTSLFFEHLSDYIFTEDEYQYFDCHWDSQVQYKIDTLSKLLRALDTGDDELYPPMLADFPQIAKFLLGYPEHIPRRQALWP